MDLSFHGKVALVTGAGIGMASAQAFAEAGAAVALADVDEEAARPDAEGLVAEGHEAIGLRCDVIDETAVEAMVQKMVSAFGRLDAAFNNAGIHVVRADTADVEGSDFDRIIAVNLRGVFNCMKHELRQLRVQGGGTIVNCSSQSGLVGIAGLGAYTASKHGVIGLTSRPRDRGLQLHPQAFGRSERRFDGCARGQPDRAASTILAEGDAGDQLQARNRDPSLVAHRRHHHQPPAGSGRRGASARQPGADGTCREAGQDACAGRAPLAHPERDVGDKSINPDRIASNIDIFDFALSDAEMAAVDALDAGLRNGPDPDVFDTAFLKARQAGRK